MEESLASEKVGNFSPYASSSILPSYHSYLFSLLIVLLLSEESLPSSFHSCSSSSPQNLLLHHPPIQVVQEEYIEEEEESLGYLEVETFIHTHTSLGD